MPNEPRSPWHESGKPPHYLNATYGLSEKHMLLTAAWAYGMVEGEVIHRLALFCFVQTHLSNKGVDALQGAIENDRGVNWEESELGIGYYILTRRGHRKSLKLEHGHQLAKTHRDVRFVFERTYKGHEFSMRVEPFSPGWRRMFAKVNDKDRSATEVCKQLKEKFNLDMNYDSRDGTADLLCWIIQDKDFRWRIVKATNGD